MEEKISRALPVVPLRGLTVLPGEIMHCDIGRKKTMEAMQRALDTDGLAFLCMQTDQKKTEIDQEDLNRKGTVCKLRQVFRIQGETVHLLVTGLNRAYAEEIVESEPYFSAVVSDVDEVLPEQIEMEAMRRRLSESFLEYAAEKNKLTNDQRNAIVDVEDFSKFVDGIAIQCVSKVEEKQKVLEMVDAGERALYVLKVLQDELEILKVDHRIAKKVRDAAEKNQRDFVLREQLKAVKEELGEGAESTSQSYRDRMEQKAMPEYAKEKLKKEISKFESMPAGSHEAPMMQDYIECVLDLPWTEMTEDNLDLKHAREILDRDHYGMAKIKDRIIEMLAVQKLTNNPQGQILCLVGPPGVGKTSIAKAIAEAMGRKFQRMSLGGVTDEAEIRGHRRTYIGSEPGRIIDAMKHAKTINPLLLFDEIDKLGQDIHGDPASAMLEVLDSAQNNAFADHYLEMPYDLSHCLLLTTANDAGMIPKPLYDRMEVIEVPSYLFTEKMEIAKRHLIPKQLEKNGITKANIRLDDTALSLLIESYTQEAGVRELERVIGSICRKVACEVVDGKQRVSVTKQKITEWLGPQKYQKEEPEKEGKVGLVNGLAWTSVGGVTLEIEAAAVPGKGNLQLTGQLGDVMQESIRAALTYVRTNAEKFSIDPECFEKLDIHIHCPEGAVPKDGPSAGIAMMTALVSVLSGIPVRCDVAMTGEITLRGRVLPIGGLREKLLAALRAGITTVIIPEKNKDSLFDVPDEVKNELKIVFASQAEDVLKVALTEQPTEFIPNVPIAPQEDHAVVRH